MWTGKGDVAFCDAFEVDSVTHSLCIPLRRVPQIGHAIRHLETLKKVHMKSGSLICLLHYFEWKGWLKNADIKADYISRYPFLSSHHYKSPARTPYFSDLYTSTQQNNSLFKSLRHLFPISLFLTCVLLAVATLGVGARINRFHVPFPGDCARTDLCMCLFDAAL